MTISLISVALAAYLIGGEIAWRRIIMPPLDRSFLDKARNETEAFEMLQDRLMLEAERANATGRYFALKATFLALWPIALAYGVITANSPENWA